jgi:hypothetical protein
MDNVVLSRLRVVETGTCFSLKRKLVHLKVVRKLYERNWLMSKGFEGKACTT